MCSMCVESQMGWAAGHMLTDPGGFRFDLEIIAGNGSGPIKRCGFTKVYPAAMLSSRLLSVCWLMLSRTFSSERCDLPNNQLSELK